MLKKYSSLLTGVGTLLFFLCICFSASAYIKRTAIVLLVVAFSSVFLFFGKLRGQVRPPMVALSMFVLMDGISCFYAVSGKLALYEFLKLLVSFCLAMLLLAFCKAGGRSASVVLSWSCALSSLISIDMIATRIVSDPVLAFLSQVSNDYANLPGVEPGIRMTSMFLNPNIFAGLIGVGVLLSLGLASSAPTAKSRMGHLVCLFINSLAFVLAFSMGASVAIVMAFLAYLLLELKGQRIQQLLLMAETLVITLLAAFPISLTSFTAWDGIRVAPLVCLAGGAALLCAVDYFFQQRLLAFLKGRQKLLAVTAAAVVALLAVFLTAAFQLTGGIDLQPGETLRRANYPDPGSYTLVSEASGPAWVVIESQNRVDTMMHTSTVLYEGALEGAAFTVPEDSIIVYYQFSADEAVHLEQVRYEGESSGKVPLGYLLLPGFIANRMQGLFANQNAIQRFVFFEDGLKIFLRSPLIGLGLGSFENGLKSVQTFAYGTRYAHNHYIQTLADTGIIGFLLFVTLLAVLAASVWFARKKEVKLAPALGAALVFVAGHALTEFTMSSYTTLPMIFGLFAVINDCCGDAFPVPQKFRTTKTRASVLLSWVALMLVFGIFLGCNIAAQNITDENQTFDAYEEAAKLDRFEWADYELAYVLSALQVDDEEVHRKAERYAEHLSKLNSNTVPLYLTQYYFETGNPERAFEMARKYADYTGSYSSSWVELFNLLAYYEDDSQLYRDGIATLYQMLQDWNAENLGQITLQPENEALIARVLENEP